MKTVFVRSSVLLLFCALFPLAITPSVYAFCEVRTSEPSFSNGQLVNDTCDTSGNKKQTLGTLLSGEDQTNNVLRVEGQFLASGVTRSNTLIKNSPAFLHCIWISQWDAVPTAGSITIYDNTSATGTAVFEWILTTAVFMPFQICPDVVMTTGIYVGFSATNDVNVAVSYR